MSLWDLYADILVPAQASLMRLEQGGIRVDRQRLAAAKKESRRVVKASKAEIQDLAAAEHEIKLSSLQMQLGLLEEARLNLKAIRGDTKPLTEAIHKQRAALVGHGERFRATPAGWRWLLFERYGLQPPPNSKTKTGLQKLGKEEWKWLLARYPEQAILRPIASMNWHAKRLSTEWRIRLDESGFTHPSYNIHTASTCRVVSGSDFTEAAKLRHSGSGNLQNIPPECRSIYTPDLDNHSFLSADWSQVQALIAFTLANETTAVNLIKHGDIHFQNACILAEALGIPLPKDKEEAEATPFPGSSKSIRQLAKPLSYGWVFGMSPHKMQKLYGGLLATWKRVDYAARSAYPGITRLWKEVRDSLSANGKLCNPWGLPSWYYQSYPTASNSMRESDFREAMGWLVQSSEALMCLSVMPQVEKLEHSRLATTTHDSFLLSTPDPARLAPRVLEVLEQPWPQLGGMQAKADLKVGPSWGELECLR